MNPLLYTALGLGLVSSFHCLGMCGPIALALPGADRFSADFIAGRLLYNFGRIATYTFMGIVFGLLGSGFKLSGYQQYLSVATGVVMLVMYVFSVWRPASLPAGRWLQGRLQPLLKKMINGRGGLPTFFGFGVLNGFLPCGVVYMALAGAAGVGSVAEGAAYMALFGLGTLPLMFGVSLAPGWRSLRSWRSRLQPLILVVAVLFILRGMNLGIPYVSPKFSDKPGPQKMKCH